MLRTLPPGGAGRGLLLVDNLHLLTDALFVYVLEDVLYALATDAQQRTLCTSLVEYLAIAACLHDCESFLFLVFANVTAYLHAFGKQFDEFVVQLVNLVSEVFQLVVMFCLVAEDEA